MSDVVKKFKDFVNTFSLSHKDAKNIGLVIGPGGSVIKTLAEHGCHVTFGKAQDGRDICSVSGHSKADVSTTISNVKAKFKALTDGDSNFTFQKSDVCLTYQQYCKMLLFRPPGVKVGRNGDEGIIASSLNPSEVRAFISRVERMFAPKPTPTPPPQMPPSAGEFPVAAWAKQPSSAQESPKEDTCDVECELKLKLKAIVAQQEQLNSKAKALAIAKAKVEAAIAGMEAAKALAAAETIFTS